MAYQVYTYIVGVTLAVTPLAVIPGVLAILALNTTTNDNTTRLILLVLMLVAVILIITGCIIALITWRKRLKAQKTYSESTQWNSRT